MNRPPDIEKTELDFETIARFDTESDFTGLSVSLLIETGSYVCIAASILSGHAKSWNSDEAVIGGHFVRLYKLISALLDQTCQHRREISFMLARMAFECIVNVKFILKNYSPELLFSYKAYSLKHEKKLMGRINESIQKRGGDILPIEERMLKSIDRSFKVSGVNPSDVKGKELRNWGGMNVYEKADDVGLGDVYLAAFGGPSHGIHGNWQDLLEYHLESDENGFFSPNLDWHKPRPQYLNAVALHAAETAKNYFQWLGFSEIDHLIDSLNELQERVAFLDSAHEQWLHQHA
tara:strand:+ start:8802 stop:9677 length:876 start_codon:yes stop_codon:yes gene_type:complete